MTSTKQLFLQHQAQTSHYPLLLEIERAEGLFLYDKSGKSYMDLISGISVSHLGHGNERVRQAIKDQTDRYMHTLVYGEMVMDQPALLASELCSLLPPSLNSVYFLNSGAEATDCALKLAKRVTGRTKIAACKNAYHGSSHAALSLNSHAYYKDAYRPLLPDVHFIEFNNTDDLRVIDHQTCCVVIEVIQGEGGYVCAEPNYLEAVRRRCNETGTLLVFDEIQSGMGKTGKLFAFEHYGITPDVLLLGKALGAGMPIGATIASRELMMHFADHPILGHITTFGGHPVIAAAARAGLQEVMEKNLMKTVPEKSQLFRELLVHPEIKSISGVGLMLGVELSSFEYNLQVIGGCLKDGLLSDWFLFAGNKIRVAPPLTITENQIRWACQIMLNNLNRFKA